jgi:hypothetical protein
MYCKYNLPIKSTELIERLRIERSALLVPGDQFGLGRGIRIGYGHDVWETIKGLNRTDVLIYTLKWSRLQINGKRGLLKY